MNTHIRYEVAKRLKEFLGESCPMPMCYEYYKPKGVGVYCTHIPRDWKEPPAFLLHDLLSRPFCEAFRKKVFLSDSVKFKDLWTNREMVQILGIHYFDGGLPAVERALLEMMDKK